MKRFAIVLCLAGLFGFAGCGGDAVSKSQVTDALATVADGKVSAVAHTMVGAEDGLDYRGAGLSVEVYIFATADEASKAKLPGRSPRFTHKNLLVIVHGGDQAKIEAAVKAL